VSDLGDQRSLFEDPSPAELFNAESAKRSLDDLFTQARRYRSSRAFHSLMEFVSRFRFYSPFNAMLIHTQMEGAQYVATPSRWLRDYGRQISPGARPLVILQPRGPVMFVFDVSDTSPEDKAPPLPREITHPFEVRKGTVGGALERTIANAKRDGVEVTEREAGSQSAGAIRTAQSKRTITHSVPGRPEPQIHAVPLRYELVISRDHSRETKYATLAHELAHLYCGHLGTPDARWWPDRRGLSHEEREFEAESVCYLVCGRLRIDNPSDNYLAEYLPEDLEVPPISLDCVMKATGLIEQMGRESMPARKAKE
jgi:hypothetical protein